MSDEVKPVKNAALVARLRELLERKQQLLDEVAPHRKTHDEIVNDPRLIEARRKIIECSGLLGPVEDEIAVLAKGLGGRAMAAEAGKYGKGV